MKVCVTGILLATTCALQVAGQHIILADDKAYTKLKLKDESGPDCGVQLVFDSGGPNIIARTDLLGSDVPSAYTSDEIQINETVWNKKQTEVAHDVFSVLDAPFGQYHLSKDTNYSWCIYISYFGDTYLVPGAKCHPHATYNADKRPCNTTCVTTELFSEESRLLEFDGTAVYVYDVDPPEETLSEIAIVLALIIFLSVWLGWMRNATTFIHGRMATGETLGDVWDVISGHSDLIADVLVLSISTMLLAVASKHPSLHSEELFQLMGTRIQTFLEVYGYGIFPIYGITALLGLLYSKHACTRPNDYSESSWFDFGMHSGIRYGVVVFVLVSAVVVALVVEAMRFVFHDDTDGTIVGAILSVFLVFILSSKNRIIHSTRPLADMLRIRYDGSILLLTRFTLEFLLLCTIHGNLPVVFSGVISSTYKNGLGFAISLALGFICGRDLIWVSKHMPLTAVLYFVSSLAYTTVVMVTPSFVAVDPLYHHEVHSFIVGLGTTFQMAAIGAAWTVSHVPKAK